MIKYIRENDGYALVTVLLIVTIFTMLAFSFMGQAANTTKQNKITEEKSQSVALAEMGIQLYQQAIINEFDEVRQRAIDAQNEYLNNVTTEITESTILAAREHGIEEAFELLTRKVWSSNESYLVGLRKSDIIVDTISGSAFKIDLPSSPSLHGNRSMIRFISTGKDVQGGISTTIEALIEIDFNSMVSELGKPKDSIKSISNLIEDPDPNNSFAYCEQYNKGSKSTDLTNKSCRLDDIVFAQNEEITFYNTTLKVNGDLNYGNKNNEDWGSSTLYVTGDFDGDQNGLANANIYVGGIANFEKLNNAKGVTIEVKGDSTFGNLNNTERVTIDVKGEATFWNIQNGIDTIICVNTLKSINQIGDGVTIYAKINKTKNSDVITDNEAFNKACSRSSFDSDGDNWKSPAVISEKYSYE